MFSLPSSAAGLVEATQRFKESRTGLPHFCKVVTVAPDPRVAAGCALDKSKDCPCSLLRQSWWRQTQEAMKEDRQKERKVKSREAKGR